MPFKVAAFLEPTWNSPAPGWPLTVSVCKKLRTYIDGVAKSVMSELISPHRPDLSARIAICTRKKIVVGRAIRCDGDPVSDVWRLPPHQYPSFWAWDEGLALIPNPNPLFPRPAEIVQQADHYLKERVKKSKSRGSPWQASRRRPDHAVPRALLRASFALLPSE